MSIGGWNTHSSTSMVFAFTSAKNMVLGDIENWDVRKVQDMDNAFSNSVKLNPILTNWNTMSATKMTFLFGLSTAVKEGCQSLTNWNTWKV